MITSANLNEIWKPVKFSNGFYEVSNTGKVKSRRYKRLIKAQKNKKGYLRVWVVIRGVRRQYRLHRLVAEHFVPNPEKKKEVNHIDGDKDNNHFSNLEWCTRTENLHHAVKKGLLKIHGEHNGQSILNRDKVIKIREMRSNGISGSKIATEFGVSNATVYSVLNKRTWKHVS